MRPNDEILPDELLEVGQRLRNERATGQDQDEGDGERRDLTTEGIRVEVT